jgi:hypothetical protein
LFVKTWDPSPPDEFAIWLLTTRIVFPNRGVGFHVAPDDDVAKGSSSARTNVSMIGVVGKAIYLTLSATDWGGFTGCTGPSQTTVSVALT